jgi:hypothetical protein
VFAQIVASALHNQSPDTLGEHVDGYRYLPGFKAQLGAQPVLLTEGFVGWNPVTTAKGAQVGTQRLAFPLGSISDEGPGIPLDGGTEVPVRFDPDRPNQTTRMESMGALWNKTPIHLTMPPHYRYRLDYLRRAASGIAVSVAAPGATPLANQAAASTTYISLSVPGGIEQVGHPNLGDLTFVKGGGHPDLVARFMVQWGAVGSTEWTRFDVSLDPGDPAYPQLPDPS